MGKSANRIPKSASNLFLSSRPREHGKVLFILHVIRTPMRLPVGQKEFKIKGACSITSLLTNRNSPRSGRTGKGLTRGPNTDGVRGLVTSFTAVRAIVAMP